MDVPASEYPYELDPTTIFNVAAGGDDGSLSTQDSVYPPTTADCCFIDSSSFAMGVFRTYYQCPSTCTYRIDNSLVRWNTASLAGKAISSAAVRVVMYNGSANTVDNRSLTADWYTAWPIDNADWTATAQTSASGTTGWSIAAMSTVPQGQQ